MREPDYRGLAALIIAATGAVGIFVLTPLALIWGIKLGDGRVLIALGGALVGAFAVWMGMKMNGGNDKEPKP